MDSQQEFSSTSANSSTPSPRKQRGPPNRLRWAHYSRPATPIPRPLQREGAKLLSEAEGNNKSSTSNLFESGSNKSFPDLFMAGYMYKNSYIMSKHLYHYSIVNIGLRPPGTWMPPSVWFIEKPLSGNEAIEYGSKLYHEIDILQDFNIPSFRPDQSNASLWTRVDSWTASGGLTPDEFKRLVVQCFGCKRVMDRRSRYFHLCPQATPSHNLAASHLHVAGGSLAFTGYPLRVAMELCRRFHCETGLKLGITIEEAHYLFVTCAECGKIMTRYSAWYHSHELDGHDSTPTEEE